MDMLDKEPLSIKQISIQTDTNYETARRITKYLVEMGRVKFIGMGLYKKIIDLNEK